MPKDASYPFSTIQKVFNSPSKPPLTDPQSGDPDLAWP
jgi:hypothetical protein